jgi:subtilisin family serine protease
MKHARPSGSRRWPAALLAVALVFLSSVPTSADVKEPRPEFVEGELLVKLAPDIARIDFERFLGEERAAILNHFDLIDVYHVRLHPGVKVSAALQRLAQSPLVEYAVPNGLYYLDTTYPSDPQFGALWGLDNTGQTGGTPDADIDAPEAWDITTGSPQVVVAVIDSGITFDHPDLAGNIYTNPGEIAGNGIDDDANGFVDDVHGWDVVGFDNDPSDVSAACRGHGTHVAGTIGAIGDNAVGVTGVAWNVQIMPIRAFRTTLRRLCAASDADLIEAIQYQTRLGIRISSNSWGSGSYNAAMRDAIRASHSLFVAAAGNNGRNNDQTGNYPSNYPLSNIIAVAATDANDQRASFSNYGPTTVDLAAPGMNILSTLPTGYGQLSGTSMATPHVAGVAALLLAQDLGLTTNELKWRIMQGVDPLGLPVLTGGRLNARGALAFGLVPQAVSVGLAPLGPTNVPQGGSFSYRTTLANNTSAPLEVQFLVFGRGVNGGELTAQGPQTIALDAGQTWTADFDQVLPANYVGAFELIASAQTPTSFDEAVVNYHVP